MTEGWLETYRGTVFRWEVDHNDHLTVAYYFARFADAGLGLLEAMGLGPGYMRSQRRACLTVDCYVRYLRELRVNDIMHVTSGVIEVSADGLVLGHKLLNSETGALCTTVEQRVVHAEMDGRTPVSLDEAARHSAEAHRVAWDGPPRERRPSPRGFEGLTDAARDTVQPWEIDVFGQSALPFFIHRFSAANSQVLAAFGMTPTYMREKRRGFSTFEFQLTVPGRLGPGDPVLVRSGLLHVGTSSLRLFHAMVNGRTGELCATLEQLGVHLDLEARRPAPLPDALRDRARAILAPTV